MEERVFVYGAIRKYNGENKKKLAGSYMLKTTKSNKGSLTVELSLLLPIILVAIALIIFLSFIMYQHVYLTAVVNSAVNRAAVIWDNPKIDFATGIVTEEELKANLYLHENIDEKENLIREYIESRLEKFNILNAVNSDIEIKFENYFIYQKIEITINQSYASPTGAFNRFFGVGETFDISAQAHALAMEPEQFIRNIDFLRDKVDVAAIRKKIDNYLSKGSGSSGQ